MPRGKRGQHDTKKAKAPTPNETHESEEIKNWGSQAQKTTNNNNQPKHNSDEKQREDLSDLDDEETSGPDFSSNFSNESMDWMRRIIRVQAADVLKGQTKSGEVISKAKLQWEMDSLKTLISSVTCKLEKKLTDLEATIYQLKDVNSKKDRILIILEFDSLKDRKKIEELTTAIDEIQQDKFKSSVQIVGLPESKKEEDDVKKIVKLAQDKIGMKLKKHDIPHVYRLGKKIEGKARDIIVKFAEKKMRDSFYQKRKKTAPHKDPKMNIYVNDQLTNYRKGLFYQARKLLKSHKLHAAWTQNGNVLVRKSEGEPLKQIRNYEDLRMLYDIDYGETIASMNSHEGVSNLSLSKLSLSNDELMSHISDYSY